MLVAKRLPVARAQGSPPPFLRVALLRVALLRIALLAVGLRSQPHQSETGAFTLALRVLLYANGPPTGSTHGQAQCHAGEVRVYTPCARRGRYCRRRTLAPSTSGTAAQCGASGVIYLPAAKQGTPRPNTFRALSTAALVQASLTRVRCHAVARPWKQKTRKCCQRASQQLGWTQLSALNSGSSALSLWRTLHRAGRIDHRASSLSCSLQGHAASICLQTLRQQAAPPSERTTSEVADDRLNMYSSSLAVVLCCLLRLWSLAAR